MAYVLECELVTAAALNRHLKSSLLFMTSLRLLACDTCGPGRKLRAGSKGKIEAHSDLIALKLPIMKNIHPFRYLDSSPLTGVTDVENKLTSELRHGLFYYLYYYFKFHVCLYLQRRRSGGAA